jgi:hypothetical protein
MATRAVSARESPAPLAILLVFVVGPGAPGYCET